MVKVEDDFLSVSEVANILELSRQRVLQLIDSGRLAAKKVGNSYIISKSALASIEDRKPGRPPKTT